MENNQWEREPGKSDCQIIRTFLGRACHKWLVAPSGLATPSTLRSFCRVPDLHFSSLFIASFHHFLITFPLSPSSFLGRAFLLPFLLPFLLLFANSFTWISPAGTCVYFHSLTHSLIHPSLPSFTSPLISRTHVSATSSTVPTSVCEIHSTPCLTDWFSQGKQKFCSLVLPFFCRRIISTFSASGTTPCDLTFRRRSCFTTSTGLLEFNRTTSPSLRAIHTRYNQPLYHPRIANPLILPHCLVGPRPKRANCATQFKTPTSNFFLILHLEPSPTLAACIPLFSPGTCNCPYWSWPQFHLRHSVLEFARLDTHSTCDASSCSAP